MGQVSSNNTPGNSSQPPFDIGHGVPQLYSGEPGNLPILPQVGLGIVGEARTLQGMRQKTKPTSFEHGIDQLLRISRHPIKITGDKMAQQMVALWLPVGIMNLLAHQAEYLPASKRV